MDDDTICTICGEPMTRQSETDPITQVHNRGLNTSRDISTSRKDDKFKSWEGKVSMFFHEKCRKGYSALRLTVKRKRVSSTSLNSSTNSDVTDVAYFNEHCFICDKKLDRRHNKVSTVQHQDTYQKLITVASQRNDELARAVWNRLRDTSFVENHFQYHYLCYKSFLYSPSKKNVEEENTEGVIESYDEEPQQSNVSTKRDNNIDGICSYIEESRKFQFPLSELLNLSSEKIPNRISCEKLEDRYKYDISIVKHPGRETVIYYKKIDLTQICSDWVSKKSITDFEKNAVLNFAAKILRSEIVNATYQNSVYPPAETFLEDVNAEIPLLLKNFLNDLLLNRKGKEKKVEKTQVEVDMIAHSIVAYIRPRAFIPNLQLAVGVYVYRKTGSKIVIDLLSKFGVSASYASIQLYEASTIINPPIYQIDSAFVQFIFDNTDHIVGTLDGRETFHCLDGVAVHTPNFQVVVQDVSEKCARMPTAEEISKIKTIKTAPFGNIESSTLQNIDFIDVQTLKLGNRPIFPVYYAAYAWGKAVRNSKLPSWKGFMEVISAEID